MDLALRSFLGQKVVVRGRTGVVTVDLRRQGIRPPLQHVLLYVKYDLWDDAEGPGRWCPPSYLAPEGVLWDLYELFAEWRANRQLTVFDHLELLRGTNPIVLIEKAMPVNTRNDELDYFLYDKLHAAIEREYLRVRNQVGPMVDRMGAMQ